MIETISPIEAFGDDNLIANWNKKMGRCEDGKMRRPKDGKAVRSRLLNFSTSQALNFFYIVCLSITLLPACAPKLSIGPSTYPELKLSKSIDFHDDLDREGLRQACIRQMEVLESLLSKDGIPPEKRTYYEEVADIARTVLSGIDAPDFAGFIREEFDFYRVGGEDPVLFTGYYTPLLNGSRMKDERYRYPVYGVPDDLVFVDLERFGKTGKIKGVVKGRELVPYYRREEIENGSGFRQQPILYVDDKVALFFLHIQGSGIVRMDDGSVVRLNYVENNGFSYASIGKKLIADNEITKEQMSMEAIIQYFRQHPERIDYYFNQNPSYVFFREDVSGPYGSSGTVVTPYRSIAADPAFFPKFGLVYIETEIPDGRNGDGAVGTRPFSALAFDHDSGGAIKGSGRIDIYFGEGEDAAFRAGFMKYRGNVYYLKRKR